MMLYAPLLTVFALVMTSIISSPLTIAAIIVLAVIVLAVAVFIFRSGSKKNTRVTGSGSGDWQRQGQPGALGAQGSSAGWNQQPAWGQQGQAQVQQQGWGGATGAQGQQASSWGAPNTGAPAQQGWGGATGAPGQQGAAQWGAQAQQPANPWGTPSSAQQQPANPWGAAEVTPQPSAGNPWGTPSQAQQPANPWGTPSSAQQQPANPWGGQTGAPSQPANPWGGQAAQAQQGGWEATPTPSAQDGWAQQANQGWGAQANNAPAPQQGQFGPSGQSWGGAQPAADPWNASAQASPFQAGPGTAPGAPSWQPGGFAQGAPGADPFVPDSDKTVLRAPGSQTGIGYVRVEEGKEPGRIYEVRKESLSIGRSRESDIFLEDLAVSRLHASIVNMNNGTYVLKDEGSANGTKVNGQVVNKFQTYPLQEGDRVQLGQTVLVFGRK